MKKRFNRSAGGRRRPITLRQVAEVALKIIQGADADTDVGFWRRIRRTALKKASEK